MTTRVENLGFTQEILSAFSQLSQIRLLKKGEPLLREGDIENHLYWIEEGAVKLCYLSGMDEKIIRLGYTGSIINSLSSFLTRKPSQLYLETIRQTKVKVLSRNTVQTIIDTNADYAQFLEVLLIQQLEREMDLLQESPSKRLESVLKRSPDLFQHVPLKYIASYLRMNPETLSRIRKS